MSIEFVDTGWLAVKADFLVKESVSVFSVRNYVFGSTSKGYILESSFGGR